MRYDVAEVNRRNDRIKRLQVKLFGTIYVFAAPKEIVSLTEAWRKDNSLLGTSTMRVIE